MSALTPEKLDGILRDCGYKTRRYSGRGMYGAECVGVELDEETPAYIMVADAMNTDDEGERNGLYTAFRGMVTDSLGRGTIAYFPRIKYDKAEVK